MVMNGLWKRIVIQNSTLNWGCPKAIFQGICTTDLTTPYSPIHRYFQTLLWIFKTQKNVPSADSNRVRSPGLHRAIRWETLSGLIIQWGWYYEATLIFIRVVQRPHAQTYSDYNLRADMWRFMRRRTRGIFMFREYAFGGFWLLNGLSERMTVALLFSYQVGNLY